MEETGLRPLRHDLISFACHPSTGTITPASASLPEQISMVIGVATLGSNGNPKQAVPLQGPMHHRLSCRDCCDE